MPLQLFIYTKQDEKFFIRAYLEIDDMRINLFHFFLLKNTTLQWQDIIVLKYKFMLIKEPLDIDDDDPWHKIQICNTFFQHHLLFDVHKTKFKLAHP